MSVSAMLPCRISIYKESGKTILAALKELGGELVDTKLPRVPCSKPPISGINVVAKNGWFAA